MRCHSFSPCKAAGLIGACFLSAVAIQTFVALIATAVSIGNGYTMWFAVAHVFSWPVFFLALFLSLLMMAICFLKHCSKTCSPNTEKTGSCATADKTPPANNQY